MGGEIWLDSELNKGSTFSVAFPVYVRPPSNKSVKNGQTHKPEETIEVVDDEIAPGHV